MSTASYSLLKGTAIDVGSKRRDGPRARLVALLGLVLIGAGLIAYTTSPRALHVLLHDSDAPPPPIPGPSVAQCPAGIPPKAVLPAPTNPWAPLSIAESVSVHDWLFEPARGLNLTRADLWTLQDNVLFGIETFYPPKADALAYLADPKHVGQPGRYARATVQRGGREAPDIFNYVVGPLPVTDATRMRELKEIYHRDVIPFNARAYISLLEIMPLLASYMAPLAPITEVCPPVHFT